MGGRFGKYGDAKRKAQIRKNRLKPPAIQQRRNDKPLGRGINNFPVCMNSDTADGLVSSTKLGTYYSTVP